MTAPCSGSSPSWAEPPLPPKYWGAGPPPPPHGCQWAGSARPRQFPAQNCDFKTSRNCPHPLGGVGVLRCLQAGSLPPSLPPTPSCTGSSAVIKAAETLGAVVLFLPAGLGTPPPAPPVPQFPSTRPQRTEKRPHPQRPLYCEICCCPPPCTGHVGLNKYFSMNPPITTENNKKHPLPSLPSLPQAPPPLSPPWPHLGGLQGLIVRLQPHPLCSGYGCSIEDGGGRDALHWAQLQPQGVALGCPTLPGGAWHTGGPSTPPLSSVPIEAVVATVGARLLVVEIPVAGGG